MAKNAIFLLPAIRWHLGYTCWFPRQTAGFKI